MPIELTILLTLALVSANYWIWIFSKKESSTTINVGVPVHMPPKTQPGNVEMLDLPHDAGLPDTLRSRLKKEVPLPDPAALLKKAPKTSFGSRAKSD